MSKTKMTEATDWKIKYEDLLAALEDLSFRTQRDRRNSGSGDWIWSERDPIFVSGNLDVVGSEEVAKEKWGKNYRRFIPAPEQPHLSIEEQIAIQNQREEEMEDDHE
jgi:hypothetical protein